MISLFIICCIFSFANSYLSCVSDFQISKDLQSDGIIINKSLKELERSANRRIKTLTVETKCTEFQKGNEDFTIVNLADQSVFLSIDSLGRAIIGTDLDFVKPSSCLYLFSGLTALEYINLNGLDTSESSSMWGMFKDCISLEYIDISSLNTQHVTNMSEMFSGCINLRSLSYDNLNLSSLKIAFRLAEGCKSLSHVSFTDNNAKKLKSTEEMFMSCENLTDVDLSGIDMSDIYNASSMFKNCLKLEYLNLNSFSSSSNLGIVNGMFFGCSSLKTLKLMNFSTSNHPTLGDLFNGAFLNGGELYLGKNFKIEECKHTDEMFNGCGPIKIKGKIRKRERIKLQSIIDSQRGLTIPPVHSLYDDPDDSGSIL